MRGILKNKDNKWYVTKINYDNDIKFGVDYLIHQETFDINKKQPIIKLEEGKEVDFEIVTIDNGDNGIRYATLSIKEPYISDNFQIGPNGAYEHEEDVRINKKNPFGELNYPLQFKFNYKCEFCDEKINEEFQMVCDDCKEALKDLVLERKKYNNKYKNGYPG